MNNLPTTEEIREYDLHTTYQTLLMAKLYEADELGLNNKEYREFTQEIEKAIKTVKWGTKLKIPLWKIIDENQIKAKRKNNEIYIKGIGYITEENYFDEIEERNAYAKAILIRFLHEEETYAGRIERE